MIVNNLAGLMMLTSLFVISVKSYRLSCGFYACRIVSLGMASCINQIAMAIVQIVMNNILRYYGGLSVYGSDIPIACVGAVSYTHLSIWSVAVHLSGSGISSFLPG